VWTFSVAFLLTLIPIFALAYKAVTSLINANKDIQAFNKLLWDVVFMLGMNRWQLELLK